MDELQLDQLIEKLKPQSDTVLIPIPGEEKPWEFRVLAQVDEAISFRERLKKFTRMIKRKAYPPDWESVIPAEPESIALAFTLSDQSLEPKLTERQALRLVSELGTLAMYIKEQLDKSRSKIFDEDLYEEVQDQKNESEDPSRTKTA